MLSSSYFSYLKKLLQIHSFTRKREYLQDIPFRFMNDNNWIVGEWWTIQFCYKLWLLEAQRKLKKRWASKQVAKLQLSYLISSQENCLPFCSLYHWSPLFLAFPFDNLPFLESTSFGCSQTLRNIRSAYFHIPCKQEFSLPALHFYQITCST